MAWIGAIVAAAGGVISDALNAQGAGDAASTAAQAQLQSAQLQYQMGEQGLAFQAPYRQVGGGALNLLANLYGIQPYQFTGPGGQSNLSTAAGFPTVPGYSGYGATQGPGGFAPYYGGPGLGKGGVGAGEFAGNKNGVYMGQNRGAPATPGGTYLTGSGGGANPFASFYNSPGFQFSLGLGENSINRQAAASGNAYDPTTLDALSQFAEGTASTQYNNYVQQLFGLAGLGGQAATNSGTLSSQVGANVGSAISGAGASQAAGIAGAYGAYGNAIQGGVNAITAANPWANATPAGSNYPNSVNGWGGAVPFAGQTPSGQSSDTYTGQGT